MENKNYIELLREYKKFYIDVPNSEELFNCNINIDWSNRYAELYMGDNDNCITLYPETLDINEIDEENDCIEFSINNRYRLFGYR